MRDDSSDMRAAASPRLLFPRTSRVLLRGRAAKRAPPRSPRRRRAATSLSDRPPSPSRRLARVDARSPGCFRLGTVALHAVATADGGWALEARPAAPRPAGSGGSGGRPANGRAPTDNDSPLRQGEGRAPLSVATLAAGVAVGGALVAEVVQNALHRPERALSFPRDYVVQAEDSLWSIAEAEYGNGHAFTAILRANPAAEEDIVEGMMLRLPQL